MYIYILNARQRWRQSATAVCEKEEEENACMVLNRMRPHQMPIILEVLRDRLKRCYRSVKIHGRQGAPVSYVIVYRISSIAHIAIADWE
jgi:hypothetical protein